MVVGPWENDRIGSFRCIREGHGNYGATVFGEKGITVLNKYQGCIPLLEKITTFFGTGVVPGSDRRNTGDICFHAGGRGK